MLMRVFDKVLVAARYLAVALVLVLIGVVAANIVLREGFGVALVWANEVAVALFVWTAFIGAGIAFAENSRIRFTFATDKLPLAASASIETLVTYLGLVLIACLFATSVYVMYIHRHQTFTTIPVSVVWEWAAVPVGTLLAFFGWLRNGRWTFAQGRAAVASRTGAA